MSVDGRSLASVAMGCALGLGLLLPGASMLRAQTGVGTRISGFSMVLHNPDPGGRLDRDIRLPICKVEPGRKGPVPCPATVDEIFFDLRYGIASPSGRVRLTVHRHDASGAEIWSSSQTRRVRDGGLFGTMVGPGEVNDGDWLDITFSLLRPRLRRLDVGERVGVSASAGRKWR